MADAAPARVDTDGSSGRVVAGGRERQRLHELVELQRLVELEQGHVVGDDGVVVVLVLPHGGDVALLDVLLRQDRLDVVGAGDNLAKIVDCTYRKAHISA